MKFDELDRKMRVFETAHDHCVLPGLHIVARLDGRGFTRLTKETHDFEAPFDPRFRDLMVDTLRHVMAVGFKVTLSAHCYWILRKEGLDPRDATARLSGMSTSAKNELLFARGINFNDLPAWQKRGIGVTWQTYDKQGRDPRSGATTPVQRRRLHTDLELPMGDAYAQRIRHLLTDPG